MPAARSTVTLHGLELDPTVLATAGGALPTSYDGLPVAAPDRRGFDADDGPVPAHGWRRVSDRLPDHVVWVAPSAAPSAAPSSAPSSARSSAPSSAPSSGSARRWWLLVLDRDRAGGCWRSTLGWPETARAGRVIRAGGVRLDWPAPEMTLTAAQLTTLEVRVGRYADDGSAAPLDWDPDDPTHVVGHVLDATTGETLDFQPQQAFAGFGTSPRVDAHGAAWLPLRWTTYDVETLPPGDYRVTAQLTALPVRTPDAVVHVVAPRSGHAPLS